MMLIFFSHRLRPFENEAVSGDMRVQITFEQFKVRIFGHDFFNYVYLINDFKIRPNVP